MNENDFKELLLDKDPVSWFKEILKNPNHTKNPYAKSIKILTNNFKHFKVGDILKYWKNVDINEIEKNLNDQNWMYVYCILYGFRKNLAEEDINIYFLKEKKSPEQAKKHLLSLSYMTDEEVKHFLSNSPITHKNKKVINGFHRVCAMIGRLIRNEKYIDVCEG